MEKFCNYCLRCILSVFITLERISTRTTSVILPRGKMDKQGPDSEFDSTNIEPEYTKSSGNVFKDLGFEDDKAENLKIRADLMISLRRFIKENGLTQEEAADLFGVSQPRISDLVNCKIEKFSIDTLVNMITKTGAEVDLKVDTSRQKRLTA